MNKRILFGTEYRDAIKSGVDQLANAVKVTLGAKGRNVVIDDGFGRHRVTKDGVSVAEEVFLADPVENLGAQMVKEVARKVGEIAGDGTTTSTVIAQAIISEAFKNIAAGASPIELKKGIDIATKEVIEYLKTIATEVGIDPLLLKQVASVSANNDEVIGELISSTFGKIGIEGVVTVEESQGTETTVDIVEGMKIDGGFISPSFITNAEKGRVELDNPYILIANQKISNFSDVLPILSEIANQGQSLLIIADDIEGEALATLVVNKIRNSVKVAAIKTDNFGDRRKTELSDIALLTGAEVVSYEKGLSLEDADTTVLGRAKKVIIDKNNTTIIGGEGDITERISEIKTQIEDETDKYDRIFLKERLAKLTGGIAVIKVGANSEIEMKEKKDRVDDAVFATKASMEEGIVAGGGIALLRASDSLSDVPYSGDIKTGYNVIKKAIVEPLKQIVLNAGLSGEVVIDKLFLTSHDSGFNVKTEQYVDMIEEGIIDPVKVTRIALENASSVAGTIITTETVIIRDEQGG